MEIADIQGETRKTGGHHANERVRRRGMIPAVIYGHGQDPETVSLSLHDTVLALEHMTHVVNLKIDAKEERYLVKAVQYDHLQQTPIHMDLMRIDLSKRVQVKLPVELRGTPDGVSEGGNLVHVITDLEVECLVLEIPERLRIRVDHLGLNDTLTVKELELPDNVTVMHAPDDVVAVVHPPRGMTTAEAETLEGEGEGEDEPKIIGKGGKEEGQGDGARGD